MSTSFEKIKDASQLQDFLKKHAAQGTISGSVAKRDVSPSTNNYVGMKQ